MKKQIIALLVFLLVLLAGMVALYIYIDQNYDSDSDTLTSTSVASSCENIWLSGTNCYPSGGYACFEGQLYTCYNDGYAVGSTKTEDLQVCGSGWLKNYASCSTFDDGICGVVVIDGVLYNEEDVNSKDCQFGGNPVCGNGSCDLGESCGSCVSDCGACPVTSYCGDGICDYYGAGEWCGICGDCGICAESTTEDSPSAPPANSEVVAEVVNENPVPEGVTPIVGPNNDKKLVNDFTNYVKETEKELENQKEESKRQVQTVVVGTTITIIIATITSGVVTSSGYGGLSTKTENSNPALGVGAGVSHNPLKSIIESGYKLKGLDKSQKTGMIDKDIPEMV